MEVGIVTLENPKVADPRPELSEGDTIICPFCGEEFEWDGDEVVECPNCGGEFVIRL